MQWSGKANFWTLHSLPPGFAYSNAKKKAPMPSCDYCNQTYRGWAIKDGDYRYCMGLCHERGQALLDVLKKIPESQVENVIADAHRSLCRSCEKNYGVDVYSSHRFWSAIFYWSWKTSSNVLCRQCGRAKQLKDLAFCLIAGWWSAPGIIITPFFILSNIIALFRRTDSSPSERFKKLVRINLARHLATQMPSPRDGIVSTPSLARAAPIISVVKSVGGLGGLVTRGISFNPDRSEVLVKREGEKSWRRAGDAAELTLDAAPTIGSTSLDIVPDRATPRDEPSQAPNRFNFIAMHWRGLYPLWISYWVINVVGAILAAAAVAMIGALFSTNSGYSPTPIFWSILCAWLCVVTIVVWQIVGFWRSANRHGDRRAALGKKSPWAVLAKIAVVLGVLNLLGTFAKTGLPQLLETAGMAFMGDPDIPEYSFRIMRDGTEVEITGGFKYGLTDEFRKLLKASRQIKVVHLDSLGGRLGEAEKLYQVIRENGLVAYVPTKCASACTIAFAGGKQRYIARDAVLAFHGPAFPGMDKQDLASSISEQTRLFRAAGFGSAFITRALATPNSDLWKPTVAELLEAKVITGISDGSQFASSGWGEITKEEVALQVAKALPVFAALKDRLPESYDGIVDAFYTSYLAGKTETEMIGAARAKLHQLLRSLTPLANDDVLVDVARLYADEIQALWQKSGATSCYDYALGMTDRNYSEELPEVLVKRRQELNERVVRTAAKRAPVPEASLKPIRNRLRSVMTARGITAGQIELLQATDVPITRQGEYCVASIDLFLAIASLPQRDAATFLRFMWTDK
jgi:hypothetical protein